MSNETNEPLDRDAQLEQILAEYLRSVETNQPISQQHLLRKYPDFANDLRAFFLNQASLNRLVAPLKNNIDEPTIGLAGNTPASDKPRVRYFGDYELMDEIARGGMGVVYKAKQVSLNRIVAVKMILAGQLADASAVKRFRQEAEAAASLDHPHIVPVHEVGEHAGQHYFAMGFIDGTSLANQIAAGPLEPRRAAEIMEQVAKAVQYAHEHGVIHRDLKPSNVLLDREGRPRVTDFGLAKVTTHDQSLTQTGQMIGTPGYMPPEQVDGKDVSAAADVYGLGAILYALLTGRPPFQAATPMETMLQVLSADPVPPRQLNASVPRDLDTIVRKCLEKWPDWRYASARDVAEDLRKFLAGEPIVARRAGLVEQGMRWFYRQSRSVALAVAVVAFTLLLTIAGIASWANYQEWRLGRLMFKTDHPPLTAEILNSDGQLATPAFTVPTQEPLAVPAGEYQVRLSADGRLSETYQLSNERGFPSTFTTNLEDQLIGNADDAGLGIKVNPGYALVSRNHRADVLLLEAQGLRHPRWPSNGAEWSLPLDKPAEHSQLKATPGLRWPWYTNTSYVEYARTVLHPQVVREAPDLNGDGMEDIIVAARHQAWILAVSALDGKIIWFAGRGAELLKPQELNYRNPSSVLGTPLVIPDVNNDGVLDLLANFGDEHQKSSSGKSPRRWQECLSGKTGEKLWEHELAEAWFKLPDGMEPPDAARWLVTVQGYTGNGGGGSSSYDDAYRDYSSARISGDSHFATYPLQVVQFKERSFAVTVAGTRLIGIDLATGKQVWEPLDIGLSPVRPPQFADLDGDGQPEMILVQLASNAPPPTPNPNAQSLVSAWSLIGERKKLWEHTMTAEWLRPIKIGSPPMTWPVIEDLNGDGHCELIVPNRTPDTVGWPTPWAELELLEGATGKSRWRKRMKTMDKRIDFFVTGPDINGDGEHDVFVATHNGPRCDLFIDALSAKDGEKLWWSKQAGTGQYVYLERLAWWNPGHDGWPRLIAFTIPSDSGGEARLSMFSAGTGKLASTTPGIHEFELADADGDGLAELFTLKDSNPQYPHQGGWLQSMRGVSNERWRHLGGHWQTGADYNGDGNADLIAIFPSGFPWIASISGSTGQRLWKTNLDNYWQDGLQPLTVDLDGDQTPDVLVFNQPNSGKAGGGGQRNPVVAISGRTGQKIFWSTEMPFYSSQGVLFAEAHDLDGNGSQEVIFSAVTDWDYPHNRMSGAELQHWLVAVEGHSGKLRWRVPLSMAYGKPGAASVPMSQYFNHADVHPVFGDLNGDKILDLIVPAEVEGSPGKFELRAVNGRDGSTLWSRPFDDTVDTKEFWQNLAPPTLADLDGDGKLDFIGLEYLTIAGVNGQNNRKSQIFNIDAASGSRDWRISWTSDVPHDCGHAHSRPDFQRQKPKPLVLKNRGYKSLLAVGLWGGQSSTSGTIKIINPAAGFIAETNVRSTGAFQIFVNDLNNDGDDDIWLLDSGIVRAFKIEELSGGTKLTELWEFTPPGSNRHVMELLPETPHHPATIVLQSGNQVYGHAADTAELLWSIAGPNPLTGDGSPMVTTAQLLPAIKSPDLPVAVFQWGEQLMACRTASRISEKPVTAFPSITTFISPNTIPPRQTVPDPRLIRRARFELDSDSTMSRAILNTLWALTLGLGLLWIPGNVLWGMIKHRRWSLQTMLLLPLLVAVMLVLLRIPLPQSLEPALLDGRMRRRLELAILAFPLIYFITVLVGHVKQRQWGWLLGWGITTIALGMLWTSGVRMAESQRWLAPEEKYVITAWHIPLAVGFYCTSVTAMALLFFDWLRRWLFPERKEVTKNSGAQHKSNLSFPS